MTFHVGRTWEWPDFQFRARGAGRYVAAYLPQQRAGWVQVPVPGGAGDPIRVPFGAVPTSLRLQSGHDYVVDFVLDRPATIYVLGPMKVTSVHRRAFRAGLQESPATVLDGTVVVASAANQLSGVTASVVALAVRHGTDGGRVFTGDACSAPLPAYACQTGAAQTGSAQTGSVSSSPEFFFGAPPDVDVVGTTYSKIHPDAYLAGTYTLADGPPLVVGTLVAFGVYLQ